MEFEKETLSYRNNLNQRLEQLEKMGQETRKQLIEFGNDLNKRLDKIYKQISKLQKTKNAK